MVRDRDAFTKTGGQDPEPATVAAPALSAVQPVTGEGDIAAAAAASPVAAGTGQPAQASGEVKERRTAPWRELPWLTLLLAVGIVAALAFIAGVLVENHHLQ
ncbi:hypothetical protein [Streptomyces sp. NBC_00212]|uniref:hypothetical protein n=1 Tax=Streptomyces sp. NBC_00212 TaxID=2975684 RepID=UPI0032492859